MPQTTKTFRVFVSSTFTDMRVERRILQQDVFPHLKALCESKGASFQDVDLRWGVNEDAQRDQQIMDICLGEIARCQRLSPKPNFIILLGDKYGWQPIPARIPSAEMESIRGKLTDKDKAFVNTWYHEDLNARPPEYVLQPRGDEYSLHEDWQKVEKALQVILRAAVNRLSFSEEAKIKYFASATHQEIMRGALMPPVDVMEPREHVFAYLRTIQGLPEDITAKDYIDLAGEERDTYSKEQLDKLKKDLKRKLPVNHIFPYGATWTNGCTLDDAQAFGNRVYEDLKSVIEKELQDIADIDPLDREKSLHEDFKNQRREHFTGRKDALKAVTGYLNGPSRKVFSIIGGSGTGKTSLLAKAIDEALGRKGIKVFRFLGTTSATSDAFRLLSDLIDEITAGYGTDKNALLKEGEDETKFSTLRGLQDILSRCLSLANEEKPLLIFLDALDQLSRDFKTMPLDWVPKEIPEQVKFIVSALPEIKEKLSHTDLYDLGLMPVKEGEELLETWLGAIDRTLTPDQMRLVIERFAENGTPLYLKLAFEKAKRWHSYNTGISLKPDIDGVLGEYFDGLEGVHGLPLVTKVCGYLLSGKYQGLTENELLDLLVSDAEYWPHFLENCHPDHRQEVAELKRLPIVIWSRLFLDLEPYLTNRNADGLPTISFYHRKFMEYAVAQYLKEPLSYHGALADYFEKAPLYLDEKETRPNVRKVVEQPYQETKGQLWDAVTETLCDLQFIQAKAAVMLTFDMNNDFRTVLQYIPDNIFRFQKEEARQHRLAKYVNDLNLYAQGAISKLEIPQSWDFFNDESNYLDAIDKTSNYPRIEKLKDFESFLGQEAGNLHKHSNQLAGFAMQQAWNYSETGPVGDLADKKQPNIYKKLLLRNRCTRPPWNPHPQKSKILRRHTKSVESIAMTPDGKTAISCGEDNVCIVWDLNSGKEVHYLKGHTRTVNSVAITPDGKKALSGSGDGTCILWDLVAGKMIKILEGHTSCVLCVAMTPDCRVAISGDQNKICILWDLNTGKVCHTLTGHTQGILSVAITPDGTRAITGPLGSTNFFPLMPLLGPYKCWCDDPCILWDLRTGQVNKTLIGHTYNVTSIAIAPSGLKAVSSSDDKTCIIWDLESGKAINIFTGHAETVKSVAVTPDSKWAISGSGDGKIMLWDVETVQAIKTFVGHSAAVGSVDITGDGKNAISCSADKTCIVWDLEARQAINTRNVCTDTFHAVATTPDGKRALSGSWGTVDFYSRDSLGKVLILWDLAEGKPIAFFNVMCSKIMSLAITPDGNRAVIGSDMHDCIIIDLNTGQTLNNLKGHSYHIFAVAIAPDGKSVLTGSRAWTNSDPNSCILWDLESGQVINTLNGRYQKVKKQSTFHMHALEITAAAITPDGKIAVSGTDGNTCIISSLDTGNVVRTLKGHTGIITAVAIAPDGRKAITGSTDSTCIVWDLTTGKVLTAFKEHTDQVRAVAFTPDCSRGISASLDNNCIVWDINSGKVQARFIANYSIYAASLFPNGICLVGDGGGIDILNSDRRLLCPGMGITTIKQIWNFNTHQYNNLTADCPYCGFRFAPPITAVNCIGKIMKKARLTGTQAPCLNLPVEAWNKSDLSGNCPKCGNRLKYNPFIGSGPNCVSIVNSKAKRETDATNYNSKCFEILEHVPEFQVSQLSDKINAGDALLSQNDLSGAHKTYSEALNIAEYLSNEDPSDISQYNLGLSHGRFGDVLQAEGNLTGALNAFMTNRAILSSLLKTDSLNMDWQRDLMVSYIKIGDVLSVQGELSNADKSLQEAIKIAEYLISQDPSHTGWHRDLFVCYLKKAEFEKNCRAADRLVWWQKAYDQLSEIRKRGVQLSPQDENILAELTDKLGIGSKKECRNVNVPDPHAAANPVCATRLNIEYQQQLAKWQNLPWWKRLTTTKPQRPKGI